MKSEGTLLHKLLCKPSNQCSHYIHKTQLHSPFITISITTYLALILPVYCLFHVNFHYYCDYYQECPKSQYYQDYYGSICILPHYYGRFSITTSITSWRLESDQAGLQFYIICFDVSFFLLRMFETLSFLKNLHSFKKSSHTFFKYPIF